MDDATPPGDTPPDSVQVATVAAVQAVENTAESAEALALAAGQIAVDAAQQIERVQTEEEKRWLELMGRLETFSTLAATLQDRMTTVEATQLELLAQVAGLTTPPNPTPETTPPTLPPSSADADAPATPLTTSEALPPVEVTAEPPAPDPVSATRPSKRFRLL